MDHTPRGGLLHRAYHGFRRLQALQITVRAGYACYFLVLSVFPALLLLLGLLRYTALDAQAFLFTLEGFLPEALLPYAENLIAGIYGGSNGAVLSVSAVTALWSASRGIHGLFDGLRAVYGVPEQRGYLRSRLLSLCYTFAFLLVLVLTLVLHVFGTALVARLQNDAHPFIRFLAQLIDLRFFLLLGLQTALFCAMYAAIPGDDSGLGDTLPGALGASLGWLLFSRGFSLYIDYFGDHTQLYGDLYTVALSMLWLFFCVSILFYGGAVNHFLREGRRH